MTTARLNESARLSRHAQAIPPVLAGLALCAVGLGVWGANAALAGTGERRAATALLGAIAGVVIGTAAYGHWLSRQARQVERRQSSYIETMIEAEARSRRAMALVESRNQDLRLLLEHVEQGLLMLTIEGTMETERSQAVERWLGPYPQGAPFWDYVSKHDQQFSYDLRHCWDALREELLPLDLCVEQMPRQLVAGGISYQVTYHPVLLEERLHRVLLLISEDDRGWSDREFGSPGQLLRERFEQYATQIRALAKCLGRCPVTVQIEAGDLRVPRYQWGELWGAFDPLLRSALRDGLETVRERLAAHKPDCARVLLRGALQEGQLQIEIIDDGKGIQPGRVGGLIEAARRECVRLGGSLEVSSSARGTSFLLRLPMRSLEDPGAVTLLEIPALDPLVAEQLFG